MTTLADLELECNEVMSHFIPRLDFQRLFWDHEISTYAITTNFKTLTLSSFKSLMYSNRSFREKLKRHQASFFHARYLDFELRYEVAPRLLSTVRNWSDLGLVVMNGNYYKQNDTLCRIQSEMMMMHLFDVPELDDGPAWCVQGEYETFIVGSLFFSINKQDSSVVSQHIRAANIRENFDAKNACIVVTTHKLQPIDMCFVYSTNEICSLHWRMMEVRRELDPHYAKHPETHFVLGLAIEHTAFIFFCPRPTEHRHRFSIMAHDTCGDTLQHVRVTGDMMPSQGILDVFKFDEVFFGILISKNMAESDAKYMELYVMKMHCEKRYWFAHCKRADIPLFPGAELKHYVYSDGIVQLRPGTETIRIYVAPDDAEVEEEEI